MAKVAFVCSPRMSLSHWISYKYPSELTSNALSSYHGHKGSLVGLGAICVIVLELCMLHTTDDSVDDGLEANAKLVVGRSTVKVATEVVTEDSQVPATAEAFVTIARVVVPEDTGED